MIKSEKFGLPAFQASNGTWICRNGGSFAFGSTEYAAVRKVLEQRGLFLFGTEWPALAEYLQTEEGKEWANA